MPSQSDSRYSILTAAYCLPFLPLRIGALSACRCADQGAYFTIRLPFAVNTVPKHVKIHTRATCRVPSPSVPLGARSWVSKPRNDGFVG